MNHPARCAHVAGYCAPCDPSVKSSHVTARTLSQPPEMLSIWLEADYEEAYLTHGLRGLLTPVRAVC